MGCGSTAGNTLAAQQKQQQQLTDQAVSKINSAFQGFNPQFYQNVGQAYQNYALPQLGQQYQQTQNQLGFRLANQGLGHSSQATDLYNKLGQAKTQATQQVAQNALQQEQQLQQQVSQEKAQLIGQAQTATNPNAIGQAAIANAAGFAVPSSFQPIGNLFNQFGQLYLANQYANTYNPASTQLNQQSWGFNPLTYSTTSNNFLPSTYY